MGGYARRGRRYRRPVLRTAAALVLAAASFLAQLGWSSGTPTAGAEPDPPKRIKGTITWSYDYSVSMAANEYGEYGLETMSYRGKLDVSLVLDYSRSPHLRFPTTTWVDDGTSRISASNTYHAEGAQRLEQGPEILFGGCTVDTVSSASNVLFSERMAPHNPAALLGIDPTYNTPTYPLNAASTQAHFAVWPHDAELGNGVSGSVSMAPWGNLPDRVNPCHSEPGPTIDIFPYYRLYRTGSHSELLGRVLDTSAALPTIDFALDRAFDRAEGRTTTHERLVVSGVLKPDDGADLSLAMTAAPNPVKANDSLGYVITARNAGPAKATDVTVRDTLPAGVEFLSAVASQGSCSGVPIVCNLGTLASGASATVGIVVRPRQSVAGTAIANTAGIVAAQNDPDPTNNAASVATLVSPPRAEVRIFDKASPYNSYPDYCKQLKQLYIAEGRTLGIQVKFSPPLTEAQLGRARWEVTNGAASPASGTFAGQPNQALITTMVAAPNGPVNDVLVRVTLDGVDISQEPIPMRVVTRAEYTASSGILTGVGFGDLVYPLASDLLDRFMGTPDDAAGTPDTSDTRTIDICERGLTHRAGADWGDKKRASAPLVRYSARQQASAIVAEAVAREMVGAMGDDIQRFFAENPREVEHTFPRAYNDGLQFHKATDPDAYYAVGKGNFKGSFALHVRRVGDRFFPQYIVVDGTVNDLYDFDLFGGFLADHAAKVQISSQTGSPVGKVFFTQFDISHSFFMSDCGTEGPVPACTLEEVE